MIYSMPLWYWLKGKGVKVLVAKLNKAQNVALHWISGAFCTTPVPLLELFMGIAPVTIRLDFQLRNFMSCVSTVPHSHPLHQLATIIAPHSVHVTARHQKKHTASDNIHLLWLLVQDFAPFALFSLLLRLGHRVIDIYSHRLTINMPAHPAKASPLFDQWIGRWREDTLRAIRSANFSIGTNASFMGRGIGTAAFVVQQKLEFIFQSV